MSRVRVINDIIHTGHVQWGASKEEVKVILGGHEPWTQRVIRVATCPQVGSKLEQGIRNPQGRLGRVVLSRGPWGVLRGTTRPCSLGRLHCKP